MLTLKDPILAQEAVLEVLRLFKDASCQRDKVKSNGYC